MLKTSLLVMLLFAQQGQFKVTGRIVSEIRYRSARVSLFSRDGLEVQRTYVFRGGSFEFKNLPEGQYIITVAMGRGREARRSIEVRQALADKKGKIAVDIDIQDAGIPREQYEVSTARLAVPRKAVDELRKAYESGGDFETARMHLEKALEIAPKFEDALNNLGTIYFRQRNFEKAGELFEKALAVNPNSFAARVNLGGTLLSIGSFERALTENLKAIQVRPAESLAYAQAGMSLFFLKRYAESLPYFEEAKRIDPMAASGPGLYLARIHEFNGDMERAEAEYEQYLKLHAGNPFSSIAERRLRELRARASEP